MACHLHALLGPRTEVRNLVRTQEPEFQKRDIDEQFHDKKTSKLVVEKISINEKAEILIFE